ncbi:MAG: hypothetical protein AAF865_02325 [Pseudomonadota bacterium]
MGTNDTAVLTKLRRDALSDFMTLPVSGEYMHGRAYDVSKRYGKDTLVLIDKLGTGRLTSIFALKGWVDAQLSKLPLRPKNLTDRVMQGLSRIWPTVLPGRTETLRDRYAHHLILKMRDDGVAEAYPGTHLTGPESGWFARVTAGRNLPRTAV